MEIRPAGVTDMGAAQRIYSHWVLTSTSTFEETPPDLAEMEQRWRDIVADGLPFLVAVGNGSVLGYAYASRYKERSAYRFTVEDSVYVAPEAVGRGIGDALLARLIERCQEKGLRQMVAIISGGDNQPSLRLHRRHGFIEVGTLAGVGWKLGRSIDTSILQLDLGSIP